MIENFDFIYILVLLRCLTSHETGQNPEISEKAESKIYLIVHNRWLSAMRYALCISHAISLPPTAGLPKVWKFSMQY